MLAIAAAIRRLGMQLLVIDILVVGVALRRGTSVPAMLAAEALPTTRAQQRTGPGISTASPLANLTSLTSHSR